MSTPPWVCIIIGSDSDAQVMTQACAALEEFGVPYEMTVASAHRSPERTRQVVSDADRDGAAVFIAGAGMAAHLPGVVASLTTKPVIGVPLAGATLQGFDSLLAIVKRVSPPLSIAATSPISVMIPVNMIALPIDETRQGRP